MGTVVEVLVGWFAVALVVGLVLGRMIGLGTAGQSPPMGDTDGWGAEERDTAA